MKKPAQIKPWLTVEQMFQWLQESPDEAAHKRRMTIWLIHTGRLHASKISEILGVSVQAVWLWTNQYNTKGPKGLERKGRGGRCWAFLSRQREAELLKPFIAKARSGNIPKASEIRPVFEQELKRKVSMPYIYRLLVRHGWSQIVSQSSRVRKPKATDDFEKITRPWLRKN